MAEFTFNLIQGCTTVYNGWLNIKARSRKEAVKKINEMSQEDIEKLAYGWEINCEDASGEGDIEVHDDEDGGKIINQIKE